MIGLTPTDPAVLQKMGSIYDSEGDKQQAYQYLIDSSMKFPSGERMVDIIKKSTNFKSVKYYPMFGGVTYLYVASNND